MCKELARLLKLAMRHCEEIGSMITARSTPTSSDGSHADDVEWVPPHAGAAGAVGMKRGRTDPVAAARNGNGGTACGGGRSDASASRGAKAPKIVPDPAPAAPVRQGVKRQAQTNDRHRALGDEFLDAENYSAAVEQFRRVKSAISQTLRNNAQAVKMPARRTRVECMLKVAHCFGMLKMSNDAQSELSEVLRDAAQLLEVDKESPTMVAFTESVERFWRAVSLRSMHSYASKKNGAAKDEYLNQALYAMADVKTEDNVKTEDTPAIVNGHTGGMGVNGSSAVPVTAGAGAHGDEAEKKQKKIRCPLCKTKYVLHVKVGRANDEVKFTCTKAGCNAVLKYSFAEKN